MKAIFIFLLLQSFLAYKETFAIELSTFIQQCRAKDPNLNECVKAAGEKFIPQVAKGVSEWNILPVDPMVTPEMTFTDTSNGNNLVVAYKNIVQTGFSGMQIENADIDLEHRVMTFKLRYPHITFEADYNANGQFLDFKTEGNGKANISVWNAYSSLVVKYHLTNDHIKLDSVIVGFSFDKIFLDYTNLMLNGDEELSKSASAFINENSKEIIDSFKPELDKFYAKITQEFLQAFFDSVPYSVLFKKD